MVDDIPSLRSLFRALQQVPYLASRNIYRVADYFLQLDEQRVEQFCKVLIDIKDRLVMCEICFYWREKEALCFFCSSTKRDQSTICVVETWQELIAIEQTRAYAGLYHVLGGVISPLDGIGPENLTIDALCERITKRPGTDCVREIILTLSQTPEGETTATYIAQKLKLIDIKITVLARGMPVGTSLHAIDRLTVSKALTERRPL